MIPLVRRAARLASLCDTDPLSRNLQPPFRSLPRFSHQCPRELRQLQLRMRTVEATIRARKMSSGESFAVSKRIIKSLCTSTHIRSLRHCTDWKKKDSKPNQFP